MPLKPLPSYKLPGWSGGPDKALGKERTSGYSLGPVEYRKFLLDDMRREGQTYGWNLMTKSIMKKRIEASMITVRYRRI